MKKHTARQSSNKKKKRPVQGVDLNAILHLYIDNRLSLAEVGRRLGVTRQDVHFRVKKAGISTRLNRPIPPKFSRRQLKEMQRLYMNEVYSLDRLAQHFGTRRDFLRECLENLGVKLYKTNRPRIRLKRLVLHDLYVRERLSVRAIADRLGIAQTTVMREMHRHKIKTRPPNATIKIDRGKLYDLYVTEKLNQGQVAKILGVCQATIRRALKRHKIKHRNTTGKKR